MRRRKTSTPLSDDPAEQTAYLIPATTFAWGSRVFQRGVPVAADDPVVVQIIAKIGVGNAPFYREA